MDVSFVIFIFALVFFAKYLVSKSGESAVRDELRRDNLEPESVRVKLGRGGRYTSHFSFTATAKDGKRITGHAIKDPTMITMHYDSDYQRMGHMRPERAVVSSFEPSEEMDLETRIRFVTNDRLERLHGDRAAFLANDLDGDGMVDAEEWDLARARIEAEVRAELEGVDGAGETVLDIEPDRVPEAAPEPEPEPKPELAEAETDGHW